LGISHLAKCGFDVLAAVEYTDDKNHRWANHERYDLAAGISGSQSVADYFNFVAYLPAATFTLTVHAISFGKVMLSWVVERKGSSFGESRIKSHFSPVDAATERQACLRFAL